MNIVYLALDEENRNDSMPLKAIATFASYDEFTRSQRSADGFVIGSQDPHQAFEAVRRLRSAPATTLLPIFLKRDLGPRLALVTDGIFDQPPAFRETVSAVKARIEKLPGDLLSQGQDFRLLAYLYCRPETELATIEDWRQDRIHTYPLAQLLADTDTDIFRWLQQLTERHYLEPSRLLSRLRHCPKCDGCHHNFVDICPHSRSIDIQQTPFLHCFTCGHVAPEELFLSRGILVCPNCRSKLRHIGADYDRPMENYVCRDCGRSFVEPAVIARCLTCGAENDPDALVPREIHALRLAPRGRTAARTGSLEDIYALLDNLNYVRPHHFEALVDWLLALCRRHREERFSLLGIRLRNIETLTDQLGRHRVAELIDGFAVRLREAIRRTDLSTRSSQRNLWLLLPKTDCPACTLLFQRVSEIGDQTRQPEGPQLEFDLVTFNAPDEIMPGESARLLMARLMGTIAE